MLNYKQPKSVTKEILTYIKRSHEVNEDDIYIYTYIHTYIHKKNIKVMHSIKIKLDKIHLVLPDTTMFFIIFNHFTVHSVDYLITYTNTCI